MKKFIVTFIIFSVAIIQNKTLQAHQHETFTYVQTDPSKCVSLWEKYEGSPGYPVYNWYLQNTTSNKAVRVTILFNNSMPDGRQWTLSFDLEPGEVKQIANKTYDGVAFTYAKITGARFM